MSKLTFNPALSGDNPRWTRPDDWPFPVDWGSPAWDDLADRKVKRMLQRKEAKKTNAHNHNDHDDEEKDEAVINDMVDMVAEMEQKLGDNPQCPPGEYGVKEPENVNA